MALLTPANVYRKYETAGVPSSGEHDPVKAEIVQLLEQIQTLAGEGAVAVPPP